MSAAAALSFKYDATPPRGELRPASRAADRTAGTTRRCGSFVTGAGVHLPHRLLLRAVTYSGPDGRGQRPSAGTCTDRAGNRKACRRPSGMTRLRPVGDRRACPSATTGTATIRAPTADDLSWIARRERRTPRPGRGTTGSRGAWTCRERRAHATGRSTGPLSAPSQPLERGPYARPWYEPRVEATVRDVRDLGAGRPHGRHHSAPTGGADGPGQHHLVSYDATVAGRTRRIRWLVARCRGRNGWYNNGRRDRDRAPTGHRGREAPPRGPRLGLGATAPSPLRTGPATPRKYDAALGRRPPAGGGWYRPDDRQPASQLGATTLHRRTTSAGSRSRATRLVPGGGHPFTVRRVGAARRV